MKVICLVPFKNEEWIIPTFLSNVLPVVDEIIAIDDGSTDHGPELLRAAGVHVYQNEVNVKAGWAELDIRNRLLSLGREHGGTHFLCLDADETMTSNFAKTATRLYKQLKPGQKVTMQWLALWKCVDHYREDSSVWTNNFKDFLFCDDGEMEYPPVWMHTPRTPGDSIKGENMFALNPKHGAVAHFQFSNWCRFQLKQAWYRCAEKVKDPNLSDEAINQKYAHAFERNKVILKALPDSWKVGMVMPDIPFDAPPSWHLSLIEDYFDEYGIESFNGLDIFHVKEIAELRKKKKAHDETH